MIVGPGSGNMLVSDDLAHWRIAVVEADRLGGTCLNRGCIPSKLLVHTADVAQTVRRAGRFGIGAAWVGADWPAIRDRVFGRIDPLHDAAVAHREPSLGVGWMSPPRGGADGAGSGCGSTPMQAPTGSAPSSTRSHVDARPLGSSRYSSSVDALGEAMGKASPSPSAASTHAEVVLDPSPMIVPSEP